MARQGMRIGAARVRIARPRGRGNRMQAFAHAFAEERSELADRKACECGLAFGLELAGEPAAEINFDQRASERPHVVAAGAHAVESAVEMRILGKLLATVEPETDLVGKA